MTNASLLRGVFASGVVVVMSTASASAGGTAAGTAVDNTFSLTYTVDDTAQPPIDNNAAPASFVVDRKIDLTVVDNGDENVAPGEVGAQLTYLLTNTGNDTQAYDLSFLNEAGDDFDASNIVITYYEGTDDSGTELSYTPGDSTVDVAADDQLYIVITGDIPLAGASPLVEDDDIATITLTAVTAEPGTPGDPAVAVTEDADGNNDLATEETVFADAGADATESASSDYVVAAADLTADKTVGMVSQDGAGCAVAPAAADYPLAPFPATTTEYAIPGACVEYRITVVNGGNDADSNATNLEIADVLPSGITFVDAFIDGFTYDTDPNEGFIKPATNTVCDGAPAAGTACTVQLTSGGGASPVAGLAFGETGTIVIRALITPPTP